MVKNKNIICISSIDWDFIWQGHQEIMLTLAKNGNRVLFIENTGARTPGIRDLTRIKKRIINWWSGLKGIRKEDGNLYVFSPIVLPFPYLRFATSINGLLILSVLKKWMKIMDFTDPIVWVFLPTPLSLNIIDSLNSKAVIYYCIDNFRVSSVSAKKIKKSEIKILNMADLVFVTSKELYNYCSKFNNKVKIFPFAVNLQQFDKAKSEKAVIPAELKNIKKPVIGYVGGVHKWIDLELLKKAATRYPEYSFVFVGPLQTDVSTLSKLKNIYFLGKKEHKAIPQFINHFDACVIPYLITEYTANVYPTKLNEYLIMGKPVISTMLPEVVNFNKENDNVISIGTGHDDFIDLVGKEIGAGGSGFDRRVSAAKKNGWDARIKEMSDLIKETLAEKSRMPIDWRESFSKVYKLARRKILKVSFSFLVLYLLIFYSPLIWFLASPLKISQAPEKADVIVALSGGVGESGKAGQGYEERVGYAFELYKQGYAKNIIFSSGYKFKFKETLVMKSLAVALGIPPEAIFLEDNAKNTYENVKFSREIVDQHRWKSILLVSSPYHMARVSLVFKKNAGNIKVIYTPIPNSLFYSHPDRDSFGNKIFKRINLRQIRSIIHEYLGILYYYFKGWI